MLAGHTVSDDGLTGDFTLRPSLTAPQSDQDFCGPIAIDEPAAPNPRAAWYPYTMPFDLTDDPAVSLPRGFDEAGVPVAIQLVGRVGADTRLLRVAAAFERAMLWANQRPPLPELD